MKLRGEPDGRSRWRSVARRLRRRWLCPPAREPSPLLAHIDPARLLPPDRLLRLGTPYGGWIIPVDHGLTPESVCYLIGAGEDISFDCELVRRIRCRARIVDPTPRAATHFQGLVDAVRAGRRFPINNSRRDFYSVSTEDLSRIRFLPVGLADRDMPMKFYLPKDPTHVSCSLVNLQGTADSFTAPCQRLGTILAHQGDTALDLLKMDIEGAEYVVITDILASRLIPRLLLVEFDEVHSPRDRGAPTRIAAHVDLLIAAGLQCIAVEGSNMTFARSR